MLFSRSTSSSSICKTLGTMKNRGNVSYRPEADAGSVACQQCRSHVNWIGDGRSNGREVWRPNRDDAGRGRAALRVMVAFRRVGRMIGSSGRAAGIAGQSHCVQSDSASIARRMGAGSSGQAATIRARSAAKTPTSETAPEFAAPSARNCEFPAFSRGVPVLSSPLVIFAGRGKSSQGSKHSVFPS